MQLEIDKSSLPVYEALASDVRLEIIQLLSKNKMNIKDLSKALGISSPIVTKHIEKLEKAGIIRTEKKFQENQAYKEFRSLRLTISKLIFRKKIYHSFATYETSVPVGHYTDYHVLPTCGLATIKDFIGPVDETKYFMDPKRMDARILWFTQGFIEYKTPNFLKEEDELQQLDISMEISSEFPFSNEVWPSDITFTLNNVELGTWVSPGDFADTRGKYTPEWWPHNINQYGLLKTIRITPHGTYMDGEPMSDVTISDLDTRTEGWKLRIEVKKRGRKCRRGNLVWPRIW